MTMKINGKAISKALSIRKKHIDEVFQSNTRNPVVRRADTEFEIEVRYLPQFVTTLMNRGHSPNSVVLALCTHARHLEYSLHQLMQRKASLVELLKERRREMDSMRVEIARLQEARVAAANTTAKVATHFGDQAHRAHSKVVDVVEKFPSPGAATSGKEAAPAGEKARVKLPFVDLELPQWAVPLAFVIAAFAGGYSVSYVQQTQLLGLQGENLKQTEMIAGLLGQTADERKAELERRSEELRQRQSELQASEQERIEMERSINESQQRIATLGDEKKDLRTKVELFSEQVQLYKQENEKLRENNKGLLEQTTQLQGQVDGLRAALAIQGEAEVGGTGGEE